jgi:dihydrofolate synthase/folylpolyglutamate synthase
MEGGFQAANARLAVAVARALAERGWRITEEQVARGLTAARMPGRWETMPDSTPRVVIDGAHNPEKAEELAAVLRAQRIDRGTPKPTMLLGLLGAKDAVGVVAALVPEAGAIVVTRPSVVGKAPLAPDALAVAIRAAGFAGVVTVEPEPAAALAAAEAHARGGGADVVVAGSLYLAGAIRDRWYAADDIVIQRTSWPERGPASGV